MYNVWKYMYTKKSFVFIVLKMYKIRFIYVLYQTESAGNF